MLAQTDCVRSKMKKCLMLFVFPLLCVGEDFDLPRDFKADPNRPDVPHSFSAIRKYFKEKSGIRSKYRGRLAEAIKYADNAEIFLLSFTPVQKVPDGKDGMYFPILPSGSYAEILVERDVNREKLAQCRDAIVSLLQEEDDRGGGAFCHYPIHGIRLYRNGELIFQTSICWKCRNYYVEYPDDFKKATWVGFEGKSLWEFLISEMPIPESEIARFKSMLEKKGETKTDQSSSRQGATR